MFSRTLEPENRLVARGLETEWEQRLRELDQAQAELTRRQQQRSTALTHAERNALLALGQDLQRVWFAPTTTSRDQKELLRAHLPGGLPGTSDAALARRIADRA